MIFVDSSALAKAYLNEEGAGVVRGALDRFPGRLFISEFVALEVLTTLRTAFRDANRAEWNDIVDEFWRDYEAIFNVVAVGPEVVDRAMDLAVDYRDARARSMDLLHLATALHLKGPRSPAQVTMVTSDLDLITLSRAYGLRTFDPSREPLAALPRATR
ncbi:MAG TPA: type II toxin-antitoxin system VapC family toxin [Longimicrobium sp.]|nr:type II toxin-antitoxin system VapC family toxin [Longimicrobium sp.]